MQQNQRFLLFMVASFALIFGWAWLNHAMRPPQPQKPVAQDEAVVDDDGPAGDDLPPKADDPQKDKAEVAAAKPDQQPAPEPKREHKQFPRQTVELGSKDPQTGYRLAVLVSSRGAVIEDIELNDKRYRSLADKDQPLRVVGDVGSHDPEEFIEKREQQDRLVLKVHSIFRRHCYKCHAGKKPKGGFRINTRDGLLAGGDTGPAIIPGDSSNSLLVEAIRGEHPDVKMPPKREGKSLTAEEIGDVDRWVDEGAPPLSPVTMQVTVPQIEGQFAELGESLSTIDWELVSPPDDTERAEFRITSPDGSLEFTKTYRLHKVDEENKDDEAAAYTIDFDFSIKNLSDKAHDVNYVLQGPVGVPLENADYARKYRDVQFAYLDKESGRFNSDSLSAKEIAEGETSRWEQPILKYIGVDVQYFAALLQPAEELTADDSHLASYTQSAVEKVEDDPALSDISVSITSQDIDLKPGDSVAHQYELFAGPKREDLLASKGAESIMDLGWFGAIAKLMLLLLGAFHYVIPNYGVAIIMLTVLVRLCMFPLSRKQALGAAKMQEIKPEIDALKKKYGNDREKMGRAQMELFRKHKYNPFSGCLVLFIQMPVFFGLYRALSSSVDLRRASFLWIDNLAAPDALFQLPFTLPYLGDEFNLLPILTIVLFIVQQKMFMPPPTDEQSAMQAKMMQYMMVFMGFMFYNVPAGLCIYFISSSLWGIAERKLLPKVQKQAEANENQDTETSTAGTSAPATTKKASPKVGAAKRKSRNRR